MHSIGFSVDLLSIISAVTWQRDTWYVTCDTWDIEHFNISDDATLSGMNEAYNIRIWNITFKNSDELSIKAL